MEATRSASGWTSFRRLVGATWADWWTRGSGISFWPVPPGRSVDVDAHLWRWFQRVLVEGSSGPRVGRLLVAVEGLGWNTPGPAGDGPRPLLRRLVVRDPLVGRGPEGQPCWRGLRHLLAGPDVHELELDSLASALLLMLMLPGDVEPPSGGPWRPGLCSVAQNPIHLF